MATFGSLLFQYLPVFRSICCNILESTGVKGNTDEI